VVHPDERKVEAVGKRLPVHHANQESPDQPRPCGYRDASELTQVYTGFAECLIHHGAQGLQVLPTGQFRDNAPKHAMDILRQDDQAVEGGPRLIGVQDCGRGFVAGCLDAQNGR
jgi:hypothetical protein